MYYNSQCTFLFVNAFSKYFYSWLQTIALTAASDEEIEKEEVLFLAIFPPKVPAPTLEVIREMAVVDEWPAGIPITRKRMQASITTGPQMTPPPIPSTIKRMFIPVLIILILVHINYLLRNFNVFESKFKKK